jgi:O-antigen/teichoic acid export membrane protein
MPPESLEPWKIDGRTLRAAVIRGAGGTFLVNVVGTLLGLLLQISLARILGMEDFGLYVYATTWLAFLTVVSTAGMDTSAIRFVSAYLAKRDFNSIQGFIKYGRLRTFLVSVAVAIAMSSFAFLSASQLDRSVVFVIASLLLPANVWVLFHGSILQGLNRAVQSQSAQLVLRASCMLSMVGLWHAFRKVDAEMAMMFNLLSALITLALIMWLARRNVLRSPSFSLGPDQAVEWRSASLLLFAVTVCQVLLSQVDILMVGFFMNSSDTGLYAVASRIATLVTFGITAVNAYLAPQIAYLHAKGERPALQGMLTTVARGVFLYTVAAAVTLLLFGRWILSLFGAEFVQIYDVLRVLIVGQLLIGMCGSVGFLLIMTGYQKEALYAIASSALLAILLNLALIPELGLYGAAVATVLAIAFRSAALSALVLRKLRLNATAFAR